jgi:TldD protein
MTGRPGVELIDRFVVLLPDLVADARRLPHLVHADVRLEVTEATSAAAENGASRAAREDTRLGLGVRVLAGDRMVAPGYVGLSLAAADVDGLTRIVREALAQAHRRATINGELKAQTREKFGALGLALADTRLHPVAARRDTVPAVFEIDPRAVSLDGMMRYTGDVARQVAAVDPRLAYSYLSTLTQLSRELFASTEGALID